MNRFARVRGTIAAAVMIAAFCPLSGFAQDEQGRELEEVVVTGSYLYTGLDSPSPVSVISGEDLVAFTPPDLSTFFFDNVPQNFSSANINQTENDGQGRARSRRASRQCRSQFQPPAF